ncbi:MAG: hypothetical protein SPI77_04450 [Corynebacterium sp.]|nr:hypothetical protein [Corynebacterium sp.]
MTLASPAAWLRTITDHPELQNITFGDYDHLRHADCHDQFGATEYNLERSSDNDDHGGHAWHRRSDSR